LAMRLGNSFTSYINTLAECERPIGYEIR